jgi:hypothetical protein
MPVSTQLYGPPSLHPEPRMARNEASMTFDLRGVGFNLSQGQSCSEVGGGVRREQRLSRPGRIRDAENGGQCSTVAGLNSRLDILANWPHAGPRCP